MLTDFVLSTVPRTLSTDFVLSVIKPHPLDLLGVLDLPIRSSIRSFAGSPFRTYGLVARP